MRESSWTAIIPWPMGAAAQQVRRGAREVGADAAGVGEAVGDSEAEEGAEERDAEPLVDRRVAEERPRFRRGDREDAAQAGQRGADNARRASAAVFGTDAFHHRRDGVTAVSHISARDAGGELLVENLPGDGVGQRPFQSIANLDAGDALLEEEKKNRSIVASLPPHFPRLGSADGEVFDVASRSLGKDDDGDLVGRFFLESGQTGTDARRVRERHHLREIVDGAGQPR